MPVAFIPGVVSTVVAFGSDCFPDCDSVSVRPWKTLLASLTVLINVMEAKASGCTKPKSC